MEAWHVLVIIIGFIAVMIAAMRVFKDRKPYDPFENNPFVKRDEEKKSED